MDLKRGRIRQSDEVAIPHLLKIDLTAAGKIAAPRGDQHQPVLAERKSLDVIRKCVLGCKAEIRGTGGNRRGDIGAFTFLDIDVDIPIFPQECRQRLRQVLRQTRGVGKQMHAGSGAAGISRKISAHRIDIVEDDPGMIEQAFAGRGQLNAAAAALEKCCAEAGFQALDPRACRRQCKMTTERAARDAARLGHRDEQLQVDQIETHGEVHCCLPSSQPKACSVTSRLCRSGGSVNVPGCQTLSCSSSPRRSCSRVSSRA